MKHRTQLVSASTLLIISLCLHFLRLDQPAEVIFDEVHFGSFTEAYCCSGEYFFDIHPPVGKLLPALGLKLGGYDGGQSFSGVGTPLTEVSPVLLRFVPALAGSLIPVLVFILLLQLGTSRWAALLGAWAVLFDNALLVQTRVLGLEGILLLSILAALVLALAARSARSSTGLVLLSIAAGICVGMAVGTKFTGLTAGALVAIAFFMPLDRPFSIARTAVMCGCAAAGAMVIYVGAWVLHFTLLDQPGGGHAFGVPTGDMMKDIIDIHQNMFAVNTGLTATHPNASPWWSWPFMWRPLYYHAGQGSSIYFVGNPLVWWTSALGMLVIVWLGARKLSLGPKFAGLTWSRWSLRLLPLTAFFIAYLPYSLVPRVLFLYHYLPVLVFAICSIAVWLDPLGLTREGRYEDQAVGVRLLFFIIPIGFLLMASFTYGLVMPDPILNAMLKFVH
ncbi:MAG: phospholipid carrier-dependent glycosyltransferase [Pseudomonadota bacterium]